MVAFSQEVGFEHSQSRLHIHERESQATSITPRGSARIIYGAMFITSLARTVGYRLVAGRVG